MTALWVGLGLPLTVLAAGAGILAVSALLGRLPLRWRTPDTSWATFSVRGQWAASRARVSASRAEHTARIADLKERERAALARAAAADAERVLIEADLAADRTVER